MRYALLSDVHANLPALNAALADIAARPNIEATYHLGELIGYSTSPNEVVGTLRAIGVSGVAGNYDSTVATDYKHCGCKSESLRQEELAHMSYEWTRAHVQPDTKQFLGSLPFRIDLKPLGGHRVGPQMTLVHATPTNNLVYVTEDRSEAFLAKTAEHASLKSGDVLCFGHTHKPWHRIVDGIHFVNTGSVGRPKDGNWRAGYVVVDVKVDGVEVDFIRVPYDIETTLNGIRDAGLPEDFCEFLRTGGVNPTHTPFIDR